MQHAASWILLGKSLAISMVCKLFHHDNLCTDGTSLFWQIIIISTFVSWSCNEIVCAINCTNNLKGFAFIFCFKRLSSNRCFVSSLGEFNVISGNLNNFLTREKSFILCFYRFSEYISAESSVSEVFTERYFER